MLSLTLALALSAGLPIFFESNAGQLPNDVLARGRVAGRVLDVRADRLELDGASIELTAGRASSVRFERPLEAQIVLRDFGKAPRAIPSYERAVLRNVWPGIDLVLSSREGQLSFDLLVAPGADPARALLTFASAPELDRESGALFVRDGRGVLRLSRPIAFQAARIDAAFEVRGRRAGFVLGAYDRTRPLLIDPVVEYATYLSESGDSVIRSEGEFIYLAHALTGPLAADPDFYIAKIDPRLDGAASLISLTQYSGNNTTAGPGTGVSIRGLDISSNERIVVCGLHYGGGPRGAPFTDTDDVNAAMPRMGAGFAAVIAAGLGAIEHVSSFSDSGVSDCAFDQSASTFFATGRSDVGPPTPTTPIANMTGWGYLVQVDPDDDPAVAGDDLLFSSRLGINSTIGYRIAVDPSNNVVLGLTTSNQTGPDVDMWVGPTSFQTRNDEIAICKFATALGSNALLGCTYLGGTSGDGPIADLLTDALGNIYVYAQSGSADFPTTGPTPIAGGPIVARLTPDLASLDAIYFFPANSFAQPSSIDLLDNGSVAVLDGYFGGPSWPFTSCAITQANDGSNYAVLDSSLSNIVFGTRLPGLFGRSQAALPGGRVAIGGVIFASQRFAPWVDGYGTTTGPDGILVLSTDQRCLDLQLTGANSSNLVSRGDVVMHNFSAINVGPDAADDVAVDITLPSIVELVVAQSSGACSTTASGVRCLFGTWAATSSATIALTTVATSTGAGLVTAQLSSSVNDLDAANNSVMLPLSVGNHLGPCGPVSIYGVCAGDVARVCADRYTEQERLVETDCAAMNQVCVPAAGVVAAHCEGVTQPDAGSPDAEGQDTGGGADTGSEPNADASVGPDGALADAGVVNGDASGPTIVDGGVIVETDESCDCSSTGDRTGGALIPLMLGLLYAVRIISRRR